ncbi:MAG TPA: hypothetical protein VJV75_05615 [Candidatus Polarisedimenticolia bacterium]|nr:hypothetical protein [Candidatus Polarisedimenticolia bacterium]
MAPACARLLRAVDAHGLPVFQSIAVALPQAARAAAPLHVLERGGRRWDRLEIGDGADGWLAVTPGTRSLPEANLALLEAPALPACGARGDLGDTGAALQVFRERVGYRAGIIGARVERRLAMGRGGEVALLRLLDERGADPGLVFDAAGDFVGATLPAPPAARGSLAALAPMPDDIPEIADGEAAGVTAAGRTDAGFPASRPSPSASETASGYVARALLDAGPGAGERGIDLIGAAMRTAGPSASLLIERGVREFAAGRMAGAIDDFRSAAALDPASSLARFNLGVALGTSGLYSEAADALAGARDLDPGHSRTRYQLVLALAASHRTEEARLEYQALLGLDPTLAQELKSTPGL